MDSIVGPSVAHIKQMDVETSLVGLGLFAVVALFVAYASSSGNFPGFGLSPYLQFIYANFIKPHKGKADGGQQSALESFYAAQVGLCAKFQALSNSALSGQYLRYHPKAPSLWP